MSPTSRRRWWIAGGLCVAALVGLAVPASVLSLVVVLVGGWLAGATAGEVDERRRRRRGRSLAARKVVHLDDYRPPRWPL